jgi:hypothetical protein
MSGLSNIGEGGRRRGLECAKAALGRRDEEIPDGVKTLGTLYRTTREKIELGWEVFESSTTCETFSSESLVSRLYNGRESYLP